MGSSWVSVVVALGLILGFYYTRRQRSIKSYKHQKSFTSTQEKIQRKKENHSKPGDHAHLRESTIPILSKTLEHKKKKAFSKNKINRTASLLLHPHSLEQAKLQYQANASSFQGLYELIYQASQGNMPKPEQQDLLKALEYRINATDSQHLELVWRSSVHSPVPAKTPGSENVFRVWLKYLKGWGLQRSLEAGEICWSLNGNILEQNVRKSEKNIN